MLPLTARHPTIQVVKVPGDWPLMCWVGRGDLQPWWRSAPELENRESHDAEKWCRAWYVCWKQQARKSRTRHRKAGTEGRYYRTRVKCFWANKGRRASTQTSGEGAVRIFNWLTSKSQEVLGSIGFGDFREGAVRVGYDIRRLAVQAGEYYSNDCSVDRMLSIYCHLMERSPFTFPMRRPAV